LCRTDLKYLCRVLGYNDVSDKVHGRLVSNLQKFQGGTDEAEAKSLAGLKEGDAALPSTEAILKGYKPAIPNLWDLSGPRQRLNMIPRGHLKTTVATVAHSIQWIINYPNVRILLFTHSDGKAKDFLGMIKNHFTQGETFRYLFPEHVPWGKQANDFGNQEHFDTLARTKWIDKEHTVQFLTIDSAKAGGHFDVIKCDDVVDETNIITVDRIESVKRAFAALEPLVDKRDSVDGGQRGWWDLTGTFYHYSDLNYETYELESKKLSESEWIEYQALPEKGREEKQKEYAQKERTPELRNWVCNVQSAAPNWPDPKGPYLWPERYGYKILKAIENDPRAGPAHLAAQYLMNPVPLGTGLLDDEKKIVWTPRKVLNELYARLNLYVAVDLAGMDENAKNFNKNDFTAITLGGFGTDGHLYILESIHGRPTPHEVIRELFAICNRHPRIIQIKIEKEAHARVLLPFLKAEESKRGKYLPILALPRDNQQAKTQKLKGLQPWFERGMIHIAEDLPCKAHAKNEIMRFPKFKDDWLDTVHDLMATATGGISHEVMGDGPQDASRESDQPDYEAAIYGSNEENYTSEAIMGW
jgi:predicted phage terminase large subunit-like protein